MHINRNRCLQHWCDRKDMYIWVLQYRPLPFLLCNCIGCDLNVCVSRFWSWRHAVHTVRCFWFYWKRGLSFTHRCFIWNQARSILWTVLLQFFHSHMIGSTLIICTIISDQILKNFCETNIFICILKLFKDEVSEITPVRFKLYRKGKSLALEAKFYSWFITQAATQNGKVFVHCSQGVSRSAALVIAYAMWRTGRSFDDVRAEMKVGKLYHWSPTLHLNPYKKSKTSRTKIFRRDLCTMNGNPDQNFSFFKPAIEHEVCQRFTVLQIYGNFIQGGPSALL